MCLWEKFGSERDYLTDFNVYSPVVDYKEGFKFRKSNVAIDCIVLNQGLKGEYFR